MATARITRRGFFLGVGLTVGGLAGGVALDRSRRLGPSLLRPPGASGERAFLAACVRCGQCIEACPPGILRMADAGSGLSIGTPYFSDVEGPCNLCQGLEELRCIAECPTTALEELPSRRDVAIGIARIDTETCLPWVGVVCRACWHACPFPDDAIYVDEVGHVVVREEGCVGCGLCVTACLTEVPAIRVIPTAAVDRAEEA